MNASSVESNAYDSEEGFADDETEHKSESDLSVIFEEVAEQLKCEQQRPRNNKSWTTSLTSNYFDFPKYLDNPIYDEVMVNFSPEEQCNILKGIQNTQLINDIASWDFNRTRHLPPLLLGLIFEVIKSRLAAEAAKRNRKERQKSEKYKLLTKLKKQERQFSKLKRETKATSAAIREMERARQQQERRARLSAHRSQEED